MSTEHELMTPEEVADFLRVSVRYLKFTLAKKREGFPKPLQLGRETLRWKRSDIYDWLDQPENASAIGG